MQRAPIDPCPQNQWSAHVFEMEMAASQHCGSLISDELKDTEKFRDEYLRAWLALSWPAGNS